MNTCIAALQVAPKQNPPLILASSSASRLRLLTEMGVSFTTSPTDIDESVRPQELPVSYVTRIAQEKALPLLSTKTHILSADTIVALGHRILRKAQSAQEAYAQISMLSGRRHRVLTAVVLTLPGGVQRKRLAQTHVSFKPLDKGEKEAFIQSGEWRNVAVYRIEGMAGRFVKQLNGLSSTICGLPLFPTYQLLRGEGFVL